MNWARRPGQRQRDALFNGDMLPRSDVEREWLEKARPSNRQGLGDSYRPTSSSYARDRSPETRSRSKYYYPSHHSQHHTAHQKLEDTRGIRLLVVVGGLDHTLVVDRGLLRGTAHRKLEDTQGIALLDIVGDPGHTLEADRRLLCGTAHGKSTSSQTIALINIALFNNSGMARVEHRQPGSTLNSTVEVATPDAQEHRQPDSTLDSTVEVATPDTQEHRQPDSTLDSTGEVATPDVAKNLESGLVLSVGQDVPDEQDEEEFASFLNSFSVDDIIKVRGSVTRCIWTYPSVGPELQHVKSFRHIFTSTIPPAHFPDFTQIKQAFTRITEKAGRHSPKILPGESVLVVG
ncbi:hypothetical protein DM02DRAFT_650747 [Periconia macrospinosa]|uniref:Uncharacterized protein n=1 Tax=Periconia macrospinosa TaxID=97972 RepID=A0A2V1E4Y7_9PLEO|nr:hypothetical protein DM02DRAFT_650747 [Periconia macrospinosa]